jgi:predicted Co/Zn/Cd cation transporter (cation efflux family)
MMRLSGELPITAIDAPRAEISEEIGGAIGGVGPERWLRVRFTADPAHR